MSIVTHALPGKAVAAAGRYRLVSIAPRESVTCVIPAFNEEATIQIVVERLLQGQFDVLVVDGGSSDSTVQIVSKLCKVIVSEAGRATQMNAGAALCETEWLWFLHADSVLLAAPETYFSAIKSGSKDWGFFTPKLSGSGFTFRLIEKAMALRSKLTFVATRDQGLFVPRAVLYAQNGLPAIPLI